MSNIRTCALAIVAVCFIGGQASAQGGPRVTVENTPLPVTVTNPQGAGTPVAFSLQASQGAPTSFTVPTGQRLVIEYLSGFCDNFASNLNVPDVRIAVVTSGVSNNHFFALSAVPSSVSSVLVGQLVKIYADPGTAVTLSLFSPGGVGLTFSGLLVNP